MKLLLTSLTLAALSLTPAPLAAQTWMSAQPEATGSQPDLAVSPGGRIALLKQLRFSGRSVVTVLGLDGQPLHEFSIDSGNTSSDMDINDGLFLDENTLVVCGSLGDVPYMGAFDIATRTALWEKSLTGDGSMQKMTRNSIGHIIAHGTVTENGIDETLLCAVNTNGGFHWFRSYNPGPNANYSQEVIGIPGGDLFLLLRYDGELMVMRLTDWGHEIWSKKFSLPSGDIESARAALSTTGDLVIGATTHIGSTKSNMVLRMDGTGQVQWSKSLDVWSLGNTPPQGGIGIA